MRTLGRTGRPEGTRRQRRPAPAALRRDLTARVRRSRKLSAALSLGALVLLWWLFSILFDKPYLVPSIPAIGYQLYLIFSDPQLLASAGATYARTLVGLLAGFAVGAFFGVLMALYDWADRAFHPILNFIQGVPALSWVVFAVIWFADTETRILFILTVNTLPSFAIQIHDGVKAIPAELWDMVRSFRPTGWQLLTKLVLPGILPAVLTSWKVTLGNATRVVIVAELVGATLGVGYELRIAQERFVMASAVAWTLMLVAFAYAAEVVLRTLEVWALRWRPEQVTSHRG